MLFVKPTNKLTTIISFLLTYRSIQNPKAVPNTNPMHSNLHSVGDELTMAMTASMSHAMSSLGTFSNSNQLGMSNRSFLNNHLASNSVSDTGSMTAPVSVTKSQSLYQYRPNIIKLISSNTSPSQNGHIIECKFCGYFV